jgi:hypothetical protein
MEFHNRLSYEENHGNLSHDSQSLFVLEINIFEYEADVTTFTFLSYNVACYFFFFFFGITARGGL